MDFLKEQPKELEVERQVIGVILSYGTCMKDVAPILKEHDFYGTEVRHIYAACYELYSEGQPIDTITVGNKLKHTKMLERAGGYVVLTQLTSDAGLEYNIKTWAKIVKEYSVKRQTIKLCETALAEAYSDKVYPEAILKNIDAGISDIKKGIFKSKERSIEQIAVDALDAIENDAKRQGMSETPVGILDFDRKVNIGAPDFVVVGGRPGMCKTAWGLAAAKRQAKAGKKVGFISMEMSSVQLGKRLISMESCVNIREYSKTGDLVMKHRMSMAVVEIGTLPIFICEDASLTITDLVSIARSWKDEHDIGILYIDYLQLINGEPGKGNIREQEIAKISRRLKQLAKELHIPIVAFSQLSRPKAGPVERPKLTDLRESGAIEQDADTVILLHRWDYYGQMVDEHGKSTLNQLEMVIAKFRNGEVDRIAYGTYDKKTQNFHDWDGSDEIAFPASEPTKKTFNKKDKETFNDNPDDVPF